MNSEPQSSDFTSTRRRGQAQSLLSSLFRAKHEIPWTASRCRRYLRPLTSRVELLRKDWDVSRIKALTERGSKSCNTVQEGTKGKDDGIESDNIHSTDPDWITKQNAGRQCRQKYSARGPGDAGRTVEEQRQKAILIPPRSRRKGDVIVATPILTRARSSGSTIERIFETQVFDQHETDWLKTSITRLGRNLPSSVTDSSLLPLSWTLYAGILDALERLLKDCPNRAAARPVGARSLFSTCLRQIPSFVDEEELYFEEAAKESGKGANLDHYRDMRMEIYDDLEMSRATSSEGWKPLGEVVRAHGISIISDAILDGLFDKEFVRCLIDLCTTYKAFDDAEVLLEVFIATTPLPRRPPSIRSNLHDSRISIAFSAVADYVRLSNKRGFQYRLLTRLLCTGCLAPEWFVTPDFGSVWNEVIGSVLSEDDKDHLDAYQFLEAVMSSSLESGILEIESGTDPEKLRIDDLSRPNEISQQEVARASSQKKLTRVESRNEDALQRALDNTVISLLEALMAISLLGDEAQDSMDQPRVSEQTRIIRRLLTSLSISIQQHLIRCGTNVVRSKHNIRRVVSILFTSIMLCQEDGVSCLAGAKASSYQSCSLLLNFLSSESSRSRINDSDEVHELASSIRAIVICCRRAAGDDRPYATILVERLVSLVEDPLVPHHLSEREQNTLRQILSNTILELDCEEVIDRKYYKWLLDEHVDYVDSCSDVETGTDENALDDHGSAKGGSSHDREEDKYQKPGGTPALPLKKRRKGSDAFASDDDSPEYRTRFVKHATTGESASKYPRLSQMLLGSSPVLDGSNSNMSSPPSTSPTSPTGFKNGESTGIDSTSAHGHLSSLERGGSTSTSLDDFCQMQNNQPKMNTFSREEIMEARSMSCRFESRNKGVQIVTRGVEDIDESDEDIGGRAALSKHAASIRLTDLRTSNRTNLVPKSKGSERHLPSFKRTIHRPPPPPMEILRDVTNRRFIRTQSIREPISTRKADVVEGNPLANDVLNPSR